MSHYESSNYQQLFKDAESVDHDLEAQFRQLRIVRFRQAVTLLDLCKEQSPRKDYKLFEFEQQISRIAAQDADREKVSRDLGEKQMDRQPEAETGRKAVCEEMGDPDWARHMNMEMVSLD